MSESIRVEVRLFARLRELCGDQRSVMLELPRGSDAGACFEGLCAEFPPLAGQRSSLAVAINEEYGSWSSDLEDGDVVSFITPVSGG